MYIIIPKTYIYTNDFKNHVSQGYITLDRSCYMTGRSDYPVIATLLSNDDGATISCNCHLLRGVLADNTASSTLQCVMNVLRCPLQQRLNVTLETV